MVRRSSSCAPITFAAICCSSLRHAARRGPSDRAAATRAAPAYRLVSSSVPRPIDQRHAQLPAACSSATRWISARSALLRDEGAPVERLDLVGDGQCGLAARHDVAIQHLADRRRVAAGGVGQHVHRRGMELLRFRRATGSPDRSDSSRRQAHSRRAPSGRSVRGFDLLAILGERRRLRIEQRVADPDRAEQHLRAHGGQQLLRARVSRGHFRGVALHGLDAAA